MPKRNSEELKNLNEEAKAMLFVWLEESGHTINSGAKQLQVHKNTLCGWLYSGVTIPASVILKIQKAKETVVTKSYQYDTACVLCGAKIKTRVKEQHTNRWVMAHRGWSILLNSPVVQVRCPKCI